MIASLFGTVRSLKLDQVIIEVNGVGYLVHLTPKTSSKLSVGRDFQIFTSMVVREDSMTLFGFVEEEERELFEIVQTVSGIGPKVALAITSAMTSEDLAQAVHSKDERSISAIQGIGKKGAQRLILELEGKLDFAVTAPKTTNLSWRDQLVDALTGLGFTKREAEISVNELAAGRSASELNEMNPSELLKLALSETKTQRGLSK
jgi:holliday junction DNA helicase RuvA